MQKIAMFDVTNYADFDVAVRDLMVDSVHINERVLINLDGNVNICNVTGDSTVKDVIAAYGTPDHISYSVIDEERAYLWFLFVDKNDNRLRVHIDVSDGIASGKKVNYIAFELNIE